MNCRKARRLIVTAHSESEWSPSVSRHVESCEDCRAWAERDARVRVLLAWKRCEQPDQYLPVRLAARLRAAIADGEPRLRFHWRELFPSFSFPLVRYGLAALFIGMVTFQFLATPRQAPQVPPVGPGPQFALGGFAPVAPATPAASFRWEDPRSPTHFQRPPWIQYAAWPATNIAPAGIPSTFGWRRFVENE